MYIFMHACILFLYFFIFTREDIDYHRFFFPFEGKLRRRYIFSSFDVALFSVHFIYNQTSLIPGKLHGWLAISRTIVIAEYACVHPPCNSLNSGEAYQ